MNNAMFVTNGLILRGRAREAKNMILTDHDEEIQRTWIVEKDLSDRKISINSSNNPIQ